MAIAFDNAVAGGVANTGSSLTWSHTCSGTNRFLVVGVITGNQTADTITGITYAGVSMTRIAPAVQCGTSQGWTGLWYLVNPTSGANNVIITSNTGSTFISGCSSSYTGVAQTGQPDSEITNTSGAASSFTTTLTTNVANDWTVLWAANNQAAPVSAGAGTTSRASQNTVAWYGVMMADSNGPISPAGSNSLVATSSTGFWASGMLAMVPASAGISVTDTEVESESVSMTITDVIKVSDSETSIGESVSMLLLTPIFNDIPIQVGVSSYKWETATLQTAAQQFTVRPSITCKIVDESNIFNQQMFNNNEFGGISTWSGSSCIAPDGNILAISKDSSGNLTFAKITDGTQVSQWEKAFNTGGVVVASSGATNWIDHNPNFGSYTGFHIGADISCSSYIGSVSGGYVIDIYAYHDTGSHYDIIQYRSTDGGVTFTGFSLPAQLNISKTTLGFFGLSAGKPVYVPSTGKISATVFSIVGNAGASENNFLGFMYSAKGDFSDSPIDWNYLNDSLLGSSASGDFVMHSVGSEYVNGTYYVMFSTYRQYLENTNNSNIPAISSSSTQNQFFGNFGLYLTRVLQITDPGTGNQSGTVPVWDEPREILTFNSSSSTNDNQCLYPSLRYDGSYLWATFRGDLTTSVSETSVVTTQTNYYTMKSKDFLNFDYPVSINDFNGNIPSNWNGLNNSANGLCKYFFVGNQNGYYYFIGDGALWQYIQNDVIADVSNDIISCQVQDQTGGTSSLNLTINNASGKWAGPSPSGTNYQAIWKNGSANKNSKVYLQLGYYSAIGAETIPRNVYYIANITQNVSANQNDLVIVGQDWNLLLNTTQTRFSYTFQGPDLYNDPFINTTVSNWNTNVGTWNTQPFSGTGGLGNAFTFNVFTPWTTYQLPNPQQSITDGTFILNSQSLAILSGYPIHRPSVTLSCSFYISNASGSTIVVGTEYDFYPFYINANNYIQVQLIYTGSNWNLNLIQIANGNSTSTSLATGITLSVGNWYPIYINLYNYAQQIDVLIGASGAGGNVFNSFGNITASASSAIGQQAYQGQIGVLPSVAIGTNGSFGSTTSVTSAPLYAGFGNLRFSQYTYSQTIGELVRHLGTKAHIFNYAEENDYIQDLYYASQWNAMSGSSFTLLNRQINLSNNNAILQNSLQYTDGEIEFDASVSTSASSNFGFDFVFRSQSVTNINSCYKIRFMNSSNHNNGTNIVKCSLLISGNNGTQKTDELLFSSIIPDNLLNAVYPGFNNLEIDLTQINHYQISFNKGWIYVFINKIMVLAWYDNNYDVTYSSGYWGFSTINPGSTNSNDYPFNSQTVYIKNITFPTFWNQNPVLSLNPGDDITSTIGQALQTVFGWMFSDLRGYFKFVTLKNSDIISFFYGNGATNYLLYTTSVNSSNIEYYNSVLVVGDGVSYVATSGTSISNGGVLREEVIVDYTITTLSGATARANQELANIQKYGAQPAPQQQINPGSEVFDVVNIQDMSIGNTTNLNGNFRLYTQSINIDNQSNYNLTLGTGTITSSS